MCHKADRSERQKGSTGTSPENQTKTETYELGLSRGRQKGTRNRATAEARAAAEATGILPLNYMLSVMRDANAESKRRDAMAMAAAPYLHPKISTVEAKLSAPGTSEVPHIRVTFVRPNPRPELDGENGKIRK